MMMSPLAGPSTTSFGGQSPEFEKLKARRLGEIMAHEQAHASAAGSLAGPIQIEFGSNGMPVGGHVNIAMPGLDPANPGETYSQAKTVFGAATAPGGDMSSQDASVAARAQAIMGQAQVLMAGKQNQQSQPPS